jgi:hypothetical protein
MDGFEALKQIKEFNENAKAGMREKARDGFGEKASGGGGKAERKIFSIMLARKVNRTETSLRNCAALSFICT